MHVQRRRYRGDREAIRALVQDDQVHRDVYLDPELFEIEMEELFAKTWIYVGHESQVPKPGDFYTCDIGREPVVMVRQADGSVRVLRNRCAHKGARLVTDTHGSIGKFFRCPYHAWTYRPDGSLLAIPLKNAYGMTRLQECAASKGLAPAAAVHSYRGFVFCRLSEEGPEFHEYFGGSLSSIDYMADRSPEGELEVAGGVLRYMHDCNWKMFVENLNDTMHPMVAHESAAGTAKRLWADKPADAAEADGDRAACAVCVGLRVLRQDGRARVRERARLFGCEFQHPFRLFQDAGLRSRDDRDAWRGESQGCARYGAAQHRLLPDSDHQGRDPGDPCRAADRGGQDADRKLDVPPQGRAGTRCCSGH